jgi:hypothetical protein
MKLRKLPCKLLRRINRKSSPPRREPLQLKFPPQMKPRPNLSSSHLNSMNQPMRVKHKAINQMNKMTMMKSLLNWSRSTSSKSVPSSKRRRSARRNGSSRLSKSNRKRNLSYLGMTSASSPSPIKKPYKDFRRSFLLIRWMFRRTSLSP